jgi:PAS domain-containing protein
MNVDISTGTVFDRVALICGAISMCIGGLGLAGWVVGSRILTAVRLDFIPMAPNTALIVILLGCVLISGIAWHRNRTIRIAIVGILSLCILIAGLTLIEIVTGIDLNIDHLLVNATGMIGTIPVGHMSPVTAICFLLGSAALLLLLFKKNDLVSLLGTVIALVGGVVIIGYWYGAPLLYGGTVIPVALTTAVALGVFGVGLNAAAGPDTWPLSSVTGVSTRARILRGLLPVILLLVLIVNWINVVIVGHADSGIILLSAVTAVLSLVVVYVMVSKTSSKIGDAVDQSERERKKAENALRESGQRFSFSQEAAELGTWELDLMKHTAWRSLRHDQIFGYEKLLPEWTYEMFLNHVLFEDRSMVDTKFKKALENFSDWDFECRIHRKDDTIRWIWAKGRPEYNDLHEPTKMFGIVQDITGRKRAEEEIKRSFERFKAVMDGLDALVYVVDMKTYDLLFINKSGKDIWGEIEGQTCWKIIQSGQSGPCPFCTNNRLVGSNGNPTGVYHWEFQNTVTRKWYDCRDSAIRWLDGHLVRLEIATDITERKQAEDTIALTSRKLTLMNDVTYQYIQNKVTAVRGYVELSKDVKTNAERLSFIEKEEHILADIHHLIKDTRQYQEIGVLLPRWIPVEQSIRIAGSLVSPKPDISIDTTLHGLELYSDPLIEKIFANLIENAVIHGKTTTRITFSFKETPGGLILICEDDGVGISPEVKAHLFDRSVGENIHFGLFFVRECLVLSGMTITETGEPGKGARLEITVPKGAYRFGRPEG